MQNDITVQEVQNVTEATVDEQPEAEYQKTHKKDDSAAFSAAYDKLQQLCNANEPWPAAMEFELDKIKAVRVADVFFKLGLRQRLYEAVKELGSFVPDYHDVLKIAGKARNQLPFKPYDLLVALRRQLRHFTSNFSRDGVLRARHIFNVHLDLFRVKSRRFKYMGLTFLPGRHRQVFHQGQEFVDLDHLTAATITMRPFKEKNGSPVDTPDLKLFAADVDFDSGIATFGGTGTDAHGNPYNRCLMARHWAFTPYRGAPAKKCVLDAANVVVMEAGLDMYESIEDAIVEDMACSSAPTFPQIFLAFSTDNVIDFEHTPVVEQVAQQRLNMAMRKEGHPYNQELVSKLHKGSTWAEMSVDLSEEDKKHLLISVYDHECRRPSDGSVLVPLPFFEPYSAQEPVKKATRVLADMPEFMKGRRIMLKDGTYASDSCLARCQVVRLTHEEATIGSTRGVMYDFSVVPDYQADEFRPYQTSFEGAQSPDHDA